jgi:SAM-dependent methyltransferase
MSLQSYYEDSFQSEKGRRPSDYKDEVILSTKALTLFTIENKNKFLPHLDWPKIRVLELGAGRGGVGLQLAKLGARITIVDFSPSAIEQGEKLFAAEGFAVEAIVGDVTHPDLVIEGKFDIIVDSHLLHCLTMDPDRTSYLGLVREHLTPEGIFVVETMVHRKKLFVPDGFMFDQQNILWQMFGKWTPVRRILDSLDLEAEIKLAHLEIVSFFYYAQYAFVPHKTFMDIPAEVLPAAVRFVAKL